MVQDWLTVTYRELQNLWAGFIEFVPKLIGAIVVFIVGWFVAIGIERIVTRILEKLKFNQLFEKGGWKEALEKAEFKVNPAQFIGKIFKWIFVIVFLLAAIEILGFVQFAGFLKGVINWLPNLVVAVAIFVVAAIFADILGKVTTAFLEKTKVEYAQLGGKIVKWGIWGFALLAMIYQLGIVRPLIQTLFTALIGGVALAFGVAFGLGGKEVAQEILQNFRKKIKKET